MIDSIQGCIDDIKAARQETADVNTKINERFKMIGADIKEVYVMLEAAFARTRRERADFESNLRRYRDEISA